MKERKPEGEMGHEKLIDYNFRVPSVEGMGSGLGFQLKNLSLPKNHEDLIKALDPKIDMSKALPKLFEEDSRGFSLPQPLIESKDNLLTQIAFGGLGYSSRLYLDRNHGYEQGIYRFENVDDIKMALVLAKTASRYLNFLLINQGQDEQYSYVDYSGGHMGGYFSVNLKIPDDLAEEAKKTDNKVFRDRFALKASNIAGRFGMTVRNLQFENQLLKWFDIQEGDACDYGIHGDSFPRNTYHPHNVDNPWQAFALHGIGAAYINRLMDTRSLEAHK